MVKKAKKTSSSTSALSMKIGKYINDVKNNQKKKTLIKNKPKKKNLKKNKHQQNNLLYKKLKKTKNKKNNKKLYYDK